MRYEVRFCEKNSNLGMPTTDFPENITALKSLKFLCNKQFFCYFLFFLLFSGFLRTILLKVLRFVVLTKALIKVVISYAVRFDPVFFEADILWLLIR